MCWTPESTTVLKVPYNKDIVNDMIKEVKSVYYNEVPRRPTRISENAKQISKTLITHQKSCELIGEFKSATAINTFHPQQTGNSPYVFGSKS